MAKRKTHKGVAKRFKVTGRGRVLFRRAGKSHLLSSKSPKRRRDLGRWKAPDNDNLAAKVRAALPYGRP